MTPAFSSQGLGSYVIWSPDSQRIAYLWTTMDNQIRLSVVDADGMNKQTVDVIPPAGVWLSSISNLLLNAWSADGSYLSVVNIQDR